MWLCRYSIYRKRKLMMWIFTGTLAFVMLILFEIQKCRNILKKRKRINPWFVFGTFVLLLSFVGIAVQSNVATGIRFVLGILLIFVGLFSYIIVLTAGIDPNNYILDVESSSVNRSGLYGRLRHPGVWSFLLFGVGFGMIFVGTLLMALCMVLMNYIYTWLQDRFFFSIYLQGYEEYKREVPFLIPRKRK